MHLQEVLECQLRGGHLSLLLAELTTVNRVCKAVNTSRTMADRVASFCHGWLMNIPMCFFRQRFHLDRHGCARFCSISFKLLKEWVSPHLPKSLPKCSKQLHDSCARWSPLSYLRLANLLHLCTNHACIQGSILKLDLSVTYNFLNLL